MEFKKYQHVERFGTDEVIGIEIGECYVFPKIDGTNASVWLDESGQLCAGSRTRQLTLEKDNAGFFNTIRNDERIIDYLHKHPNHRLFGEWLVPHSLKTYRDDAWRKFYVFDVAVDSGDSPEGVEYLPYNTYKPLLEEFEIDYINPIRIVRNGDYEVFTKLLQKNDFLVKDGCGIGEGVVIKNYEYRNKFRKQKWAKIVATEFKEKHIKTMGAGVTENRLIEQEIVDEFVTSAFIEKEYAKIVNDNNGWGSKMIPCLLNKVYHELICEEMWHIIKKFKQPNINFKTLNFLTTAKIKAVKPEVFGYGK